MIFKTIYGETIEFDPLDQDSIDRSKSKAPGEGIGPAIGEYLIKSVCNGNLTEVSQLPKEYRHLAKYLGLQKSTLQQSYII